MDDAQRDRAEEALHETGVASGADHDLVMGSSRFGDGDRGRRHRRRSVDHEVRVDLGNDFRGAGDQACGTFFDGVDVFRRRVDSTLRAAVHRDAVARHDQYVSVAAARLVRSPPQRDE